MEITIKLTGCIYAMWLLSSGAAAHGQGKEVPSDAPFGPSVRGQVFDQMGAGVADAEVVVYKADAPDSANEPLGKAKTDSMGDFEVRLPAGFTGEFLVKFTKAGFGEATESAKVVPDEPDPFVAVQLTGALFIEGVVTDGLKGEPVAHASILYRSAYRHWTEQSDDQGRFRIEGIEPGPGELVIDAEGFARLRRGVENAGDVEPLELKLEPERIVHIRVTSPEGKPIAQATVETINADGADYRMSMTNALGISTIRGLTISAKTLRARVNHPEYAHAADFEHTLELPTDKTESDHDLSLKPAGRISGTVSDVEGHPLGSARISIGEVWSDRMIREWSEYDGSFTIGGISEGQSVVTVHLNGYAPELKVAEVKAGEAASLSFQLKEAKDVTGTVVDEQGQPVANALVAADRWREYATLGLRAYTDDKGEFTLFNAPNDAFTVSVYAREYEPVTGQSIDPSTVTKPQIKLAAAPERDPSIPPAATVKVGEAAPEFEVVTLDGTTIRLADLKGKVVLLDFWATWCAPCVAEIPGLIELHNELGGRSDFAMVGVSLDFDGGALKRFIADRTIGWPQVVGEEGHAQQAADAYGVLAIPSMFLIGPDGKVIASHLRGEQLQRKVREALGTPGD